MPGGRRCCFLGVGTHQLLGGMTIAIESIRSLIRRPTGLSCGPLRVRQKATRSLPRSVAGGVWWRRVGRGGGGEGFAAAFDRNHRVSSRITVLIRWKALEEDGGCFTAPTFTERDVGGGSEVINNAEMEISLLSEAQRRRHVLQNRVALREG